MVQTEKISFPNMKDLHFQNPISMAPPKTICFFGHTFGLEVYRQGFLKFGG